MNSEKMLDDEELEQISGGVSWELFATYVLNSVDPAKYPELTAAIVSRNWVQVAIIAVPLIASGDPDLIAAFKQANM